MSYIFCVQAIIIAWLIHLITYIASFISRRAWKSDRSFATRCRIVAPKREKLQAALASLKQKESALEEAMQQLQNLHEQLERLQGMYDAKMKEKEDLIRLASILVFLAL